MPPISPPPLIAPVNKLRVSLKPALPNILEACVSNSVCLVFDKDSNFIDNLSEASASLADASAAFSFSPENSLIAKFNKSKPSTAIPIATPASPAFLINLPKAPAGLS